MDAEHHRDENAAHRRGQCDRAVRYQRWGGHTIHYALPLLGL